MLNHWAVLLIKDSAKLNVKCFWVRYFSYTQNVIIPPSFTKNWPRSLLNAEVTNTGSNLRTKAMTCRIWISPSSETNRPAFRRCKLRKTGKKSPWAIGGFFIVRRCLVPKIYTHITTRGFDQTKSPIDELEVELNILTFKIIEIHPQLLRDVFHVAYIAQWLLESNVYVAF